MENIEKGKLELIATQSFSSHKDLVYVVDFLNKHLKSKKIMLGITKEKGQDKMNINIYEF